MEYMEGEVECREGVLFGEDCEIGGDCTQGEECCC